MAMKNMQLGQILVEQGRITQHQLDSALREQKAHPGKKLGDMLVDLGILSEPDLMRALESHFNAPYIDLAGTPIDEEACTLIPQEMAEKYTVIPISKAGRTVTVATNDPLNYYALDDVRLATNMEVKVVLCTAGQIKNAIGRYYSTQQAEEAALDLRREQPAAQVSGIDTGLDERIGNAPVVRLVNSIITQAVKLGASDIHVEPVETETRVRLRIDGMLQNQMSLPPSSHGMISTRLKIMSGMDIAERRVPQDGRIEMDVDGHPVDLRVSTLPTVIGEKIVIRVLGGMGSIMTREQLGLTGDVKRQYTELLRITNGIILICGPTGSGKTSTLYSILKEMDRPEVNIITVEDPVEFRLPGINQVQINAKAGLTFASGLRSILRQDPDIIMVGEIRDGETAQIAVRAAITGHLVLSTVHTGDAPATVTRLGNMGLENFLISSALRGVVAQRLVRRVCKHCARQYLPNADERALLRLQPGEMLTHGEGCTYCNHTGYKGRAGIYEIMLITNRLRTMIEAGAPEEELRRAAREEGMVTLQEGCAAMVRAGITTTREMMRVVYQTED